MNQRTLVCLLMSSLLACGDDGGGHVHGIPDAKPADAQVCQAVTGSALDYFGYRAASGENGAAIFWTGELGTIDGETLYYDLEFWDGIDTLTGTIDLGAGNQTAYDTCAVCILGYTLDDNGDIARAFFQSGGTMNLAADPVATKNLNATVSGLTMVEISTADSTPIAGGPCLNYADATLTHDAVPNAWTCDHGKYNSGGNCTCKCGIVDPDCTDASTAATVEGCNGTTENACFRTADATNTQCVVRPANDTCETAGAALTIGTPVTGTTAGAKHDYDKNLDEATCTNAVAYGYSVPGPDVVYQVTLTQGVPYTITLNGLGSKIDMGVAVVGPAPGTNPASICKTGAPPITNCVAGKDDGGNGIAETFQYTPSATGLYYIIIDSWNYNVGGMFTLNVSQ
ncbi:MAG TPA: hypothetical protein VMZ53_02630 [Kofleriaceae bacterium]|nr:hypothetical protein [Kofleriaceae bacterium]